MELLLNLVWVLMALPAYWLWRRAAEPRMARRVTALQCVLALGCTLVLLFPVISATDDLHAMRAEMEESSSNKRAVRQAGTDKHSAWVNRLQGPPALVATTMQAAAPEPELLGISDLCLAPLARPCALHAGRSPPSSFLA
jgi:nicotinamide riboside transporter PnuC